MCLCWHLKCVVRVVETVRSPPHPFTNIFAHLQTNVVNYFFQHKTQINKSDLASSLNLMDEWRDVGSMDRIRNINAKMKWFFCYVFFSFSSWFLCVDAYPNRRTTFRFYWTNFGFSWDCYHDLLHNVIVDYLTVLFAWKLEVGY